MYETCKLQIKCYPIVREVVSLRESTNVNGVQDFEYNAKYLDTFTYYLLVVHNYTR